MRQTTNDWRVGDLCCTSSIGRLLGGIIYRVERIDHEHGMIYLLLKPACVTFARHDHINNALDQTVSSEACSKLDLLQIASEYAKLGNFIVEEARRLSNV